MLLAPKTTSRCSRDTSRVIGWNLGSGRFLSGFFSFFFFFLVTCLARKACNDSCCGGLAIGSSSCLVSE